MKLTIDEVEQVLAEFEVEKKNEILSRLYDMGDSAKAEKSAERKKKAKKEWVVALKSTVPLPDNVVASVWEMPQDSDPSEFVNKLRSAMIDQNEGSKKKTRISTFSDALNFGKPKFLKEHGIKRLLCKDWLIVQQIKEELVPNEYSTD